MREQKKRNTILDALKGVAIIAVMLYHYGTITIPIRYNEGVTFQNGLLPFGYLGVDVFFVISG